MFKILKQSNLSIYFLGGGAACALDTISKIPLPSPRSPKVMPVLLSRTFIVLALVVRSLIHFELLIFINLCK